LFTGDVALLEQSHREATLRQEIGGRRAEDAAADDDDVGLGRETLIAVNAFDSGRHVPTNLGCQECGSKVPISLHRIVRSKECAEIIQVLVRCAGFDRLIDTSCSSPTEFQFGTGRRNLFASPLDRASAVLQRRSLARHHRIKGGNRTALARERQAGRKAGIAGADDS
jgi:hypothetical protein